MVKITNASTLLPSSITIVEDNSTVTITSTPLAVNVTSGVLSITTTGVQSVNGDAGPDVVLDTDDISEGLVNQYYTDARVDTYLQSGGVSSINFGNNTSLSWNADDGTLEFPVNNEVTLQVGQENHIHVKNLSGATLTNGTVVAVTGASGSKLTVDLADYTDENLSSATIAVMTQDLNNNAVGYATTTGLVRGLNTSTLAEGDTLWLDGNGTFVSTKPLTPLHLVQIGWVVRSHATEGSIFVYVKNGWELEELHDVLITSPVDGNFIKWNATGSYWENVAPTTDHVAEGSNLYYTDGRADSRIAAASVGDLSNVDITTVAPTSGQVLKWNGVNFVPADDIDTQLSLASASIGDLGDVDITTVAPTNGQTLVWNSVAGEFEPGTIQGYTSADFDTDFATKTTTDLTEGTNLYYTDSRFDTRLATKTTDNLTEGVTNLYYTDARAQAVSINNLIEDTSPQLGADLDVNDFSILNSGANAWFNLGNDTGVMPQTHAKGAYRSSSITGYTGATRAWFNGDISSTTLGATITGSNGRIVNNYAATTLDLNSNSLTSTGITRGLHTWLAQSPTIQNTGGTASTLAQNRNIFVQGMFLEGSNITVNESSSIYINQFYEGDDGTGTVTNAYGLYINDAGTSGATVTNKYSIYSNGANSPMYHAGTVTVGAITIPNIDGSAGQVLTTDGFGNLSFTTPALAFSGDLLGAVLQDSTNSTITTNDPIRIITDATHNTKPASIRINENEYVDGPSLLIQKANNFGIDGGYLQVQKRTEAVTGAYPRIVNILDAADIAPGSTTTPLQSMVQQFRRVYYNTHYNAWENWTQTVGEFGYDGNFNVNQDTNTPGVGMVGPANQKMNWGVPMDFQMNGTSGFAFLNGQTAVFSVITGAQAITRSVAVQFDTGPSGPTQINAIDDNAWIFGTGVGNYHPRIDPWWAYGTSWKLTMQIQMPSWASQSTVTIDKALPPAGVIPTQFGVVYPNYTNVPTWCNTGARQLTLTRPASGFNFYEYTFEGINGTLFVRDWRLDNII